MAMSLEERKEAKRAASEKYRKLYPDKVKASRKTYSLKRKYTDGTREKDTEWKRTWRKQFPEKARRAVLKKYGLTLESFNVLLMAQDGVCAICRGTDWGLPSPSVDHCHVDNFVRGILCRSCNLGLENFKDSPLLLKTALLYLEKFCVK